jgi:DNA-binding transcriptional LysR family regulator
VTVGVAGPVVLDDVDLMVRAALDGMGIAFTSEEQVAPLLAKRRLVRVLEDWCPPFRQASRLSAGLEPALGLEPRTC